MKDPRLAKIATNLVSYSLDVQPGENILIWVFDDGEPLAAELMKQIYAKGAYPHLRMQRQSLHREWLTGLSEAQVKQQIQWEQPFLYGMQGFVTIHGELNDSELSNVPKEKFSIYAKGYQEVFQHMDNRKKGVRINYPTASLAQKANMSTEAFTDFYFDVCSLDYQKLHEAVMPLHKLMDQTDHVRIIGPGTDLSFSIKGIGTTIAVGKRNVPDGEVYTSPVRDSVNGVISYNTPSNYEGTSFDDIRFTFEKGRIVEATANHREKLNKVLDTDEGARFIGEFAIGINPYILHPMNDILFDEKIAGSFHFTPGSAYEKADNGNRSSIHWDLICIQRQEYGGGEIWFDDVLIRKDGLFVHEDLLGLNPDQLKL
ncbi:aminopeptidase [Brevibacillus daliensis]|uniref:aminopeptidase n=1 Tax=Brevibacillus daliensis TaxID=2892995 RepID=UPI001E58E1D0|nr:aminopeptidase [Brevibacillus daliensis]